MEQRLIDANALWESAETCLETTSGFQALIESAPTINAVKVVRCRDCRYRVVNENYEKKGYMDLKAYCKLDTGDIFELGRHAEDDDWFCRDGKEKDDEHV